MVKRQIEIPVNNNTYVTSRSLKENHPDNQNMYESSLEFQELLKEVKIRFDTNPHFYLREDYQKLIELIRKKGGTGGNIEVDVTGNGNVVTNITSNDNTLNVTKGLARYPRARWARRGFIDLTNCKDIDYIIVPCTSKQLCLYVTNDYLKKLRHIETYESIYNSEVNRLYMATADIEAREENLNDYRIIKNSGEDPVLPENFNKIVSEYWDYTKLSQYIQPRIIFPEKLSLPANCDDNHFINCKEFCNVTKKGTSNSGGRKDPLKLLYYRKDVHNGFIQFPYFVYSDKNLMPHDVFEKTKFIFTPYMVFANPFNSTLGGVIPVKDGKLLIEKATILKNKTLELVSTGLLIRFDEYGICERSSIQKLTFILQ